jgi:DNA-binding NarL/FixJ family response regulator
VRVVIAEDSVLLREGIGRLEESGFEVAGHAGDGEDLLRKVGAHKPDIAVVDIRMPPTPYQRWPARRPSDPSGAPRQ